MMNFDSWIITSELVFEMVWIDVWSNNLNGKY